MKRISFLLFFLLSAFNAVSNDKPSSLNVEENILSKYGITTTFLMEKAFISAKSTFNQEISLEKINYTQSVALNKDYMLTTVSYKTTLGDSYFSILTNLQNLEKTTIDCTGSCECRERVSVGSDGSLSYECTCSQCKMTIEKES